MAKKRKGESSHCVPSVPSVHVILDSFLQRKFLAAELEIIGNAAVTAPIDLFHSPCVHIAIQQQKSNVKVYPGSVTRRLTTNKHATGRLNIMLSPHTRNDNAILFRYQIQLDVFGDLEKRFFFVLSFSLLRNSNVCTKST